ncbi:hypothetical protein ElyMa_001896000 [Elysia marginata]|uniref:Uncharacterized protein n=1 Tax=Elysia marginata TaxID=1093978 RepID=A0AAV4ESK7_9GAST|nr:hypothetical protein ElyMa_001896000 [Elysia marginata]
MLRPGGEGGWVDGAEKPQPTQICDRRAHATTSRLKQATAVAIKKIEHISMISSPPPLYHPLPKNRQHPLLPGPAPR